jgi:hypothetical protein
MTVSKLKALKREVEAAITAKVNQRRTEIEFELSKLSRLEGGRIAKAVGARATTMVGIRVGKKPDKPLTASKRKPSVPKRQKKIRGSASMSAVPSTLAIAANGEADPLAEALPLEAGAVEVVAIEPPVLAAVHTTVGGDDLGVAA